MRRLLAVLLLAAPAALAQPVKPTPALPAGPRGGEGRIAREQEWRIPAPSGAPLMDATVMRPPGEERAPLVVINHGPPKEGEPRAQMARARYNALSQFFVARGYVVVLPMRRGYGATGGKWAEDFGRCAKPDFFQAGLAGAADIQATIDYMRGQPFVAPDHTIVVGHSTGGWAAIALSSLNPPGVAGMIDFAGGRGARNSPDGEHEAACAPDLLVAAAQRYGETARVPMQWIYAANDRSYDLALARRMTEAYTAAGGKASFVPVDAFARDGHYLASIDTGAAIWQLPLLTFLEGLN